MKLRICLFFLFIFFIQCSGIPRYYLPENSTRVRTGLEIFLDKYADDYRNKRALLVTNHSGVDIHLRDNISFSEKRVSKYQGYLLRNTVYTDTRISMIKKPGFMIIKET